MQKVNVYSSIDQELAEKWRILWGKTGGASVFNSYEWFLTSLKTFSYKSFYIFVFEENKVPVCIIPLVEKKLFGMRTMAFPGENYLDSGSILINKDHKEELGKFVKHCLKYNDLYLKELKKEDLELIKENSSLIMKSSVSPYIVVENAASNPNFRRQVNKSVKILKLYGNKLKHEHFEGDLTEFENEILYIDRNSVKSQKGINSFASPVSKKFLKNVLRNLSGYNSLDLIYFEGNPVIFNLDFKFGKIHHSFLTAYLKNYKFLTPGKLITVLIFNRLRDSGYEIYDLSRGEARHKSDFTDRRVDHYDMFISGSILKRIWLRSIVKTIEFIKNKKPLYLLLTKMRSVLINVRSKII